MWLENLFILLFSMVTCAVASCKNNSSKISKNRNGISFHRFPYNKRRRCLWEEAINREENWSSTASSAICSEHFEAGDFYLTAGGLRRLSPEAVPVINISPCQEPAITIAQLDNTPVDSDEVSELKRTVRRLEVIAENRRRRLLIMCQQKRRMDKKMNKLKRIIRHLIKIKNNKDNG